MTALVSIDLLGQPRVTIRNEDGGVEEGQRPRLSRSWLLLAVVLQGELDRENIIEILWDGDKFGRASNLDQVTYWARKALGPASDALVSTASVGFERHLLPDGVTLTSDIEGFYDPAARNDPRLACDAIRLYRGPLLARVHLDRAGRQWVEGERTRQERQLRRHLGLIFPNADDDELENYVDGCHRGEAGKVADLSPACSTKETHARARVTSVQSKVPPIGVIAPVSAWPTSFYTGIIKGIRSGADSDELQPRRRIIVFDVAREDIREVDAVVANAVEQEIAGLIALNATWSDHVRDTMRKRGRRVVSVMVEDLSAPVCCSVLLDNKAFAELVQHMLGERPCSTAILVTPPAFDSSERNVIDFARNDKRRAYESASAAVGLKLAPTRQLNAELRSHPFSEGAAYVVEIPSYETGIGEQLFDAIAEKLLPETAIVFLNDWQAASFLSACAESGRSAKDRRLYIGAYEDTDVARWMGISTIDPQLDLIGHTAYKHLQAALDDPAFAYRTDLVPGIVQLRDSTEWT